MKKINLNTVKHDYLLRLKISQLPLEIKHTYLADCIQRLYQELNFYNISFKPRCYLADEWFVPDREPIIAIPFFLAHPRLVKLERELMLEVEGATIADCMRLLRHECGHALNYAYKLYRRQSWQSVFGNFSQPYSDSYNFRPYSKNFVQHLEGYYAQSHPDEDFAETFAVWLTPKFDWRRAYRGWRALDKLNYVDRLMGKIAGKPPLVSRGRRYCQLSTLRLTLKNYYLRRRKLYAEDFPDFHDSNLKRIFQKKAKGMLAADKFIRQYRQELIDSIAAATVEKKYTINDLLDTLIQRCAQLQLTIKDSPEVSLINLSVYLAVLVANYQHGGRYRR